MTAAVAYWPRVPANLLRRATVGAIALVSAIPLLVVFSTLARPEWGLWHHLATTVLPDYLLTTAQLMAGVALGALLLGVPPAWLLTSYRFPGSRIFQWALMLPMAMPAYIVGYTYAGMFGVAGPVQQLLRDSLGLVYGQYWFPEIRSTGGAALVLSAVLMPYVYLLARAAFIEQSACALEVSRTLGCSAASSILRVALPMARPALVAGVVLVMMETFADFGTVQYFGLATFTTGIYRTWFGMGDAAGAAQLAALALLIVFALLTMERLSRRHARYDSGRRYRALPVRPLRGMPAALATGTCLLPLLLGFGLPGAQLLYWALTAGPGQLDRNFFGLLLNSLALGAAAALVCVGLALLLAYSLRSGASLVLRALTRVATIGYAIPGLVVAIGVLVPSAAIDRWVNAWTLAHFDLSVGSLLSGSLIALLVAYQVRFLSVSMSTIESGFSRVSVHMDEVARSLGEGFNGTLRRVHWPLLRSTLLTAVLLVFVDVMKELPATLVLRPFNFDTLAVRAYELANDERLPDAALPALAIVLTGLVPVIVLSRTIDSSRPGHGART